MPSLKSHAASDASLMAGSFDAVVLPGGAQGAENLGNSPLVGRHLKTQWQRGRIVAAVCAAPIALLRHEIGLGQTLTSHPSHPSHPGLSRNWWIWVRT